MNFRLVSPCSSCPFRRDVQGFLLRGGSWEREAKDDEKKAGLILKHCWRCTNRGAAKPGEIEAGIALSAMRKTAAMFAGPAMQFGSFGRSFAERGRRVMTYEGEAYLAMLAKERDDLRDQVSRLEKALEKYGAHTSTCDYARQRFPENGCVCGLAEALKGEEEPDDRQG